LTRAIQPSVSGDMQVCNTAILDFGLDRPGIVTDNGFHA
jgi:hypothetical protein